MRYARASDRDVQVRFYAAPAPAGDDRPAILAGLSDSAQAAYVKGMSDHAPTASAFRREIASPLIGDPPPRDGQPVVDRAMRLLIATLSRPTGFEPADRIARAVIQVRPRNFSFGSYSVVQTDRQTIDITTLHRSSSLEASASVSASPGAAPVSGTGTLKGTRTLETTTRLSEAPEKLTIDVLPSCLRIVQESGHGADLTGNIRIAASLITEAAPAGEDCNLPGFDDGNVTPPPKAAGQLAAYIIGPGLKFANGRPVLAGGEAPGSVRWYPREPLVADVTLDFVLRRADSGAASYDEGEQDVSLLHGRNSRCQTVLGMSQMMPPLYAVYLVNGRVPVSIVKPERISLRFTDRETAKEMAAWINSHHSASLGPLTLDRVRDGLVEADVGSLPIDASPCAPQGGSPAQPR